MRQLADGSVSLQASEDTAKLSDGAATVSAIVGATGEVTVDIENIRGSRCEKVLDGLAKAMGGYDIIVAQKPFINVKKILMDSYVQEASAGGKRYPKAREELFAAF